MEKGKVVINTVMIDLDSVRSFRQVERTNKKNIFCQDAGIEFRFIEESKTKTIWWFPALKVFLGLSCDSSNFEERNDTYEKLLKTFNIKHF